MATHCLDVHFKWCRRIQILVFITVAMDEIDQWDTKCFRVEQAKDDHTKKILEELRDPNCWAVIAEF